MTTTRLLGPALVALAYSSTYSLPLQAQEAQAQQTDVCLDPGSSWPLSRLTETIQRVDGYRGLQRHQKDGKLGLEEYADYLAGSVLCKYLQEDGKIPKDSQCPMWGWRERMPKTKPGELGPLGFDMIVGLADLTMKAVRDKHLMPYDTNSDGYLTPADDIDGDGVITCADAKKYVPPVKVIKPTKTRQQNQPPKTPRRR